MIRVENLCALTILKVVLLFWPADKMGPCPFNAKWSGGRKIGSTNRIHFHKLNIIKVVLVVYIFQLFHHTSWQIYAYIWSFSIIIIRMNEFDQSLSLALWFLKLRFMLTLTFMLWAFLLLSVYLLYESEQQRTHRQCQDLVCYIHEQWKLSKLFLILLIFSYTFNTFAVSNYKLCGKVELWNDMKRA